jgi:hypothetical protein
MPITLNGDGAISGLTATGISAVQNLPAGSVLQVVNATHSNATSSATTTFVDTGLTATITPKFATSKILVLVSQNGISKETSNTRCVLRLLRGATLITNIDDTLGFNNSSSTSSVTASVSFLDSPATTSATTYKTQFSSGGNSASITVQSNFSASTTSTITLMEIAA